MGVGLLAAPARSALNLFDGPSVVSGGLLVDLPEGSMRLLVFVALSGGRVERRSAAGTLWPGGNDVRAAGNLRSALWRLRVAGVDLVENQRWTLRLKPGTVVDLQVVSAWAARVVAGRAEGGDLDSTVWQSNVLDLLPGWYDDWVTFERERLRQRLLHALDALSGQLCRAGRCADAVEVAMEAVQRDPLRESAQRALVEAHLAEGNVGEALRAFQSYRQLLVRELGVEPGADLVRVVRSRCGPHRCAGPVRLAAVTTR